jgi:hypothetical protein
MARHSWTPRSDPRRPSIRLRLAGVMQPCPSISYMPTAAALLLRRLHPGHQPHELGAVGVRRGDQRLRRHLLAERRPHAQAQLRGGDAAVGVLVQCSSSVSLLQDDDATIIFHTLLLGSIDRGWLASYSCAQRN